MLLRGRRSADVTADPTTIHVEVADDDTSSGIYDIFAQVQNVAPVADLGADGPSTRATSSRSRRS